jgi:hypothetical protein
MATSEMPTDMKARMDQMPKMGDLNSGAGQPDMPADVQQACMQAADAAHSHREQEGRKVAMGMANE